MHEELGHFNIRRTHSMLRGQYLWTDMCLHVVVYVGRCEVCDRIRYSSNIFSPQLQALPITGIGYRWSLNFAGPLVITPRGAKICIGDDGAF